MNGYVRAKEQLHNAAAYNANSALQNSIEGWEYKINPEQHKLISGNFLTTFSKDYANRTKMKRNSQRHQEYARQMIRSSPSEEEAARPVTPGNFLTRNSRFGKLVDWAYNVCDTNKSGQIGKSELYAGLLLVHINLAKYAGPAACFPPTRRTVNILFEACDTDKSGGIDRNEFNIISGVICAQLMGRLLVYYGCSIFLIPNLTQIVLQYLSPHHTLEPGGYAMKTLEQVIQTIFFFVISKFLWEHVDKSATNEAIKSSREVLTRQNSRLDLDYETEATVAAVTASATAYHNKNKHFDFKDTSKKKKEH